MHVSSVRSSERALRISNPSYKYRNDPGVFVHASVVFIHSVKKLFRIFFDIANQHLYLTMNETITHAEPTLKAVPGMITRIFEIAARADRAGVVVTRIGLIIVLLWIGGLKAFKYEAQGIVPFVAHSPLMSFFYADPGHYKAHMNPEGTLVPANVEWNEKNQTYPFAYSLLPLTVFYHLIL